MDMLDNAREAATQGNIAFVMEYKTANSWLDPAKRQSYL